MAISLDIFCYLAASQPRFAPRLRTLCHLPGAGANELMKALSGVLWAQGGELRQRTLESYHPFRTTTTTDPALVRVLLLEEALATVELASDDWLDRTCAVLEQTGRCRLLAECTQAAALRRAITLLQAQPVDIGYLQLYAVVERYEATAETLAVILGLEEQW